MSKETISQTEGLCKEVATCVRNAYDRGYKQGEKDGYEYGYRDGQNIEQSNAVTTKEEVAKMEYERGLNDAWKCARKFILSDSCGGLKFYEIEKIFGTGNFPLIIKDFSASECMAKIKEYEENKKADEIRVGDEVDHDGLKSVVVIVWQNCICTISQVGTTPSYTDKSMLKKTGRHFDAIEELLKQLQEG